MTRLKKMLLGFVAAGWFVASNDAFAAAESDLLVAYDQTHAAAVGGEDNAQVLAANAVAGCNAIYNRSGAGARIRIVGYHQAAQNLYQTTSKGGFVNWMSAYDLHMTDIVDAGNARGADLVTFICVSTSDGALAVAQQPGRYSAFDPSGFWSTVVAHELGGHNFGCDHRDGHTSPKTVMLHNYCGGGAQGWFSNPNIWLSGVQLLGGDSCLGAGPNGGDNSYLISTTCQGRSDAYTRIVTAPNLGNVIRRWQFTNAPASAPSGTTVTDSISGSALATVQGSGAIFTNNALRLPGGASGSGAAYLQLPGGTISSLTNVTIEIWATPLSAQNWGRILDFNNGTANYLTLVSAVGTDLNSQRFESKIGASTVTLDSGLATAAGVPHHYAITFAANGSGGGRWTWFRDGDQVAWLDVTNTLAALQDVNSWLGRSAYSSDAFANCDYTEVRISSVAMSRDEVFANFTLGPNRSSAIVTMTADDPLGTASFNSGANWSDSLAPGAGKTYETYRFRLRTPADSTSRTFAGQSLNVNGGGIVWKGTSSSTLTINNLSLNGSPELIHAGSGTWTLAGNVTVNSDEAMVRAANGPINLVANLSGGGDLLYANNTVTLGGNNAAFTGKILIGDGRTSAVQIDSAGRLGTVPATFVADQLTMNRGTLLTMTSMTLSNDNRGIQLGVNGGVFNVASGTTLTLASTLSSPDLGAIVGSLGKTGAGTLILSGPANTFNGMLKVDSGSTSANDGALRIANNVVMAGAHSPIYINNNTSGSSTLQLDGTSGNITLTQSISLAGRNGTTPAIQNIAGTNSINGLALYTGGNNYIIQSDAGLLTFYGGVIQSGITGARTLTFQGSGDSAITSTVQNGSATPLNLVKTGTGKLTVSGANTYTGTTTVNGGTLLVNNLTGTNTLTVASSGTLGGNGVVPANVIVQSGGKISPGASVGILTVSNVTLNAGSTTFMEISKSPLTNDQLRVSGTLTYGGTLAVTNLSGTLALGDSFVLFNAAGKVGSFVATNFPALDVGLAWNFNSASGVLSVVSSTNTPPTISSIANQTVNEDVPTGALALTVGDTETAVGSLTLNVASSNPALVSAGNVVFGGSGSSRTVNITPALNQNGSAIITLAVSDGSRTTTTAFQLTVNPINDPPTISLIVNQVGSKNTPLGPLAFTINDPETAADSLTLNVTSSNPGFVPVENIALGGSGANRNVTITPATDQTGSTLITIFVSDGLLTTSNSFTFTINAIAQIRKADNTVNLNLTNSWVGNVVPDAAATAVWDSTVTAANSVALGANLSWGGIMVSNPAGPVTITAGNTLTLGALGVDMTSASQNLTVNSGLAIGAVNQAWNVASGRTLTVPAAFTRPTGATLMVGGDTGTVACNRTLANSIVGPWSAVSSSGTAANNSAAGFTYATVSGGNFTPYLGATAQTAFNWTSGNPSTQNYDVSGTTTALGVARTANAVRYTGAAGSQNWGNNNTTALTLNGLMNAGTGTLTFSQAGGTSFGQLKAGANNELVLNAASAGIVIAIPILDGAASSALTVASSGTNAVLLSNTNIYSGNTVVNGNLQLGIASAIPGGSGKGNVTVNGALDLNGFAQSLNGFSGAGTVDNTSVTATTLTVGNNNASGVFTGVIKNSGGALSLVKTGTGALTLAGNNTFSGGVTVQTSAGTLNVNSPAALGSGTLNMNIAGATLNNTSGASLTVANPLAVSANFTFAGGSDLTFGSTVNLGSLTKTITTTAGVLTFAGVVSGSGSFTKAGTGTLALTAANTFSGPTTVSGGRLLVSGSTSTGTIAVGNTATLGGTGSIGGVVTVNGGGTLSPGASIGTLTLAVPPVLNGTTFMEINRTNAQTADLLVVNSGTLTNGGTLTVTNLGPALQLGDSFQLFVAPTLTGAFTTTNLPSLDAGLAWNLNSSLGTLSVVSSVATNPTNITATVSGNTLTLAWPTDHIGWRLQSQVNALDAGLGTNWSDVPGATQTNVIGVPINPANGSVLFRLIFP